jgi:hypothetical protein
MRKSGQFWQDVDLAISSLMLRQILHQIIIEGRNKSESLSEIIKVTPTAKSRDHVLFRYHEAMISRLRYYNGQVSV